MIAALLLVLAAASAAEPTGTLTLACEGTAADKTDLIREAARPERFLWVSSSTSRLRRLRALSGFFQASYSHASHAIVGLPRRCWGLSSVTLGGNLTGDGA
jgi:hypothetical protein